MTSSASWQPTTTPCARQARAQLLRQIREFFYARNVLEVDTPLLSQGSVTDVHLNAFETDFTYGHLGKAQSLYLQTSPEYAMKRLLCAQSGPIYQLCKAFRHEGAGRWHNPEFTMLEWYRPDFDHLMLMDEVDALLQHTLGTDSGERFTYQQIMVRHTGLDPLTVTHAQLTDALPGLGIDIDAPESLSHDDLLQLIFAMVVEPRIGQHRPCFVHGFPAGQAALARISTQDPRTADRFEVYFRGAELANGFFELADADEQRKRFEQDNQTRKQMGMPSIAIDEHFLQALDAGLPDCAGVALGVDRLLMLKTGATHIEQVINFPVSRA
ncbi:elongation factor P--(R)-beta-lysine ligase [Salinimonas sp. HHU 13199]|uniref:Elongation factor P--(R)-beta-lysine ligase n=1 Tax=Salinimonas profundi TaxID=2729140 RepID=A0ABR8LIE0_9ALTE|nr:elongation factor P--(R)-beta-lysine ligase [Salinimonas profundi]MBD3585992.1 elongation factor P--(R)-beta-lysine ligase [Salinimonas profundi]